LKKKYNLRPTTNAARLESQAQPKRKENKKTENETPVTKEGGRMESKRPEGEQREVENVVVAFNIQNELAKIKIPVPLTELIMHPTYKKKIKRMFALADMNIQTDTLNLQDERPIVTFGSRLESRDDDVDPFYVTLNSHDQMLHNCMLDSGALYNLMQKVIMEQLGLDITRPYHDLYSFDAKRVKCIRLIKYLSMSLTQLPMKSVVMDVVVADTLVNFGMLLSRSWVKNIGGTMQMDMAYATMPVFGGGTRKLYRESMMEYVVSNKDSPKTHLVYVAENNMGCCILALDDSYLAKIKEEKLVPKEDV